MTSLVLATAFFIGLHLGISATGARALIAARIGERAYLALFSLASLGAIVWMVWAYRGADAVPLWQFGSGGRHATYALMLVATYLVVAGLTTANPTAVGGGDLLQRPQAARGILKVTRHPFLWGAALWALAHLIVNGDLASLVFFGGFALLALIGPHSIDAKMAARQGEAWTRFAAETSWLPLQAIWQRRTSLRLGELGWWRFALAAGLYLAFLLFLHGWLTGVPLVSL